MYDQLACEIKDGRPLNHIFVCAGNYNAQVGSATKNDDHSIIGPNSGWTRNERGDMWLKWCQFHGMMLAHTFDNTSLHCGKLRREFAVLS